MKILVEGAQHIVKRESWSKLRKHGCRSAYGQCCEGHVSMSMSPKFWEDRIRLDYCLTTCPPPQINKTQQEKTQQNQKGRN